MKQLLILSGKGGTGKTTIASAFIKLAKARVYADCDVDAPNLHLLMSQPHEAEETDYYGLCQAEIDLDLCIDCDSCRQHCRFDAISTTDIGYQVDQYACEGCGVCEVICPVKAVSLVPVIAGKLKLYVDDKVFSTAELRMGSGNSGKLVSEVKRQMESVKVDSDIAIIDGSPGIGCPVIASLSGVDLVLIVTEPSLSGLIDLGRIVKTSLSFPVDIAVCTNKCDINPVISGKIEEFCAQHRLPFMGRIPFDKMAMEAVNAGLSIADIDCVAGQAIQDIFERTWNLLFGLEN